MSEEKTFTIGRSRSCDITLSDSTVSGTHAKLQFVGNGKILLTDCKSRNGTKLIMNGKARPVRQELLSPTDVIEFGQLRITARDLLEAIRLKYPPFYPPDFSPPNNKPAEPETPKIPWVHGPRLLRCECGAPVKPGSRCEVCGK